MTEKVWDEVNEKWITISGKKDDSVVSYKIPNKFLQKISKHTPGPWRVGTTISTPTTRKWSKEQWDRNEAEENGMVFSRFSGFDGGTGRVMVAHCPETAENRKANAQRIVDCVNECDGLSVDEIRAAISLYKEGDWC